MRRWRVPRYRRSVGGENTGGEDRLFATAEEGTMVPSLVKTAPLAKSTNRAGTNSQHGQLRTIASMWLEQHRHERGRRGR